MIYFRLVLISGLSLFVLGHPASADMIETKKAGIMNGKLLSQNKETMQFKDASGRLHIFRKEEVLFLEKSAEESSAQTPAKDLPPKTAVILHELKKLPEKIKKTGEDLSKKWAGLSAPLDRHAADAKADSLSLSMDEASRAAVAMSKKNMLINQEIKTQTATLDGPSSKTPPDKEPVKKKSFSSLN